LADIEREGGGGRERDWDCKIKGERPGTRMCLGLLGKM
jgi:hypothetical protein